MEPSDQQEFIERYRARLSEFGDDPRTLGWNKGRQGIRFGVLAAEALRCPSSSVLDVGCGFAHLYDFLVDRGWAGRYTGLDIVPDLLEVARKRHPQLDLRQLDIGGDLETLGRFDFVIASGTFNARVRSQPNEDHIRAALRAMHSVADVAVCVDFLSSYVDFQQEGAWHTDPAWALSAARELTRRVALRHDYLPHEFALLCYADDRISERNAFLAHEPR